MLPWWLYHPTARLGRTVLAVLLGALAGALPAGGLPAQAADSAAFANELQRLLVETGVEPARVGRDIDRVSLERLYDRAWMRPLWTVDGRPTPQALGVIDALARSEVHGLRPAHYEVDGLRGLAGALAGGADDRPARVARFDVSVSRSLMRLLTHLRVGRVDPRALGVEPVNDPAAFDAASLALDVSRAADVAKTIAAAEPRYAGYAALARLLARYRALAADSALVERPPPVSRSVRPGEPYRGAPVLRRHLVALGDLSPRTAMPNDTARADVYDSALVAAVVAFQRRHGLEPDGVLGAATIAHLRVPLAARVRQIETTMERWRWLPDRPPSRYAVVNIPAFRLYAFEDDSIARCPVLSANVIVGEAPGHKTPMFSATMREVVFRPYWDVPPSIARKELVPLIRRNPAYFHAEGFEIVRDYDEAAATYPPTAGNLSRVAAGTLRLRQRPGPQNALGLVKFVFPNRYNAYLHDTPGKELFERARRDFSHGCMRLQNPAAFAEFVLRGQEEWTREAIDTAMQGDRTLRVPVQRPVVVYVVYATAAADETGRAYFYADIYGHDVRLAKALGAAP